MAVKAATTNMRQRLRASQALLATCLAAMLCFSMLPAAAFAEEEAPAEQLETQATPAVSAGWIKNYGGSENDELNSVVATPDGGYVAVGTSSSSNGDLPGNKGYNDFVIAKFNASGNKVWVRNYGGRYSDALYSVVRTTDGGYVAVGSSGSSNGDLSTNKGSQDFVIAKFDANGNKVWIKSYGGSGYDSFNSVAAVAGGGYVAVGETSSSDGDLSNRKRGDFFVARFDANGNKVWIKNYGGSESGIFNSVIATTDGGYVAAGAGSSASTNGDLPGNKGEADFAIAKFDTNGNKLWIRNYGGSKTDYFDSVAATSDGGYVAVGASESSDGDLSGNKGLSDFVIAKFDTNGAKVWIRNYSSAYINILRSVTVTANGDFVAVGHSLVGEPNVPRDGGSMYFVIAKFEADGNMSWIRNYNGSSQDLFTDVTATTDGSYVAVGWSQSSDGDVPGNKGWNDFIIAKFTQDGNLPLTRKSGQNRHQTATLASQAAYPNGSDNVIIANASDYPDALASSTLAGKIKAPILLSPKDKLDTDTLTELKRLKPSTVYIIGGKGALSTDVEKQIKALPGVKSVKRLGGTNRFSTAQIIADQAIGKTNKVDEIYLVSGDNFPDALSVSSFSVIQGIPVLLTNHTKLSTEVISFITTHKVDKVTVIGGTSAVSTSTESYLKDKLHLTVNRIFGKDRYETAYQVTTTLSKTLPTKPDIIALATGDMFADALSGGASVGIRGGILVLTSSRSLHLKTKAYLEALSNDKPFIEILGGTVAISDTTLKEIRGVFGY